VMQLDDEEFRHNVRWVQMSLVPQAAMNALNPVLKVGDQVAEPMMVHSGVKKEAALAQAKEMFQRVGVPVDFINRYAFELSGGMRQRVAIAMSLVTAPGLVVLDEPTSALDPKATARIEELIIELKEYVTIVLVTHNIAQAARVSDLTAFLYLGELVEFGPSEKLFTVPEDKRTEEYLTGKFG